MSKDKDALVAYWSKENLTLREKGYFGYASRRMFERYLPGFIDNMILDVGCGQGMMMEHFSRNGNNVVGIDITPQSVGFNAAKGLTVIEADARDIPLTDNTFDLVYSLGVIEHFSGTEHALNEQVRVCKPGGIVVAVVPNLITPYCPAGILYELLTKREHKILVTYGKAFSKKQLLKLFEIAGCEHIHVEPYYGSAFLRVLFNKINTMLIDFFEDSFLSKYSGLVLWGMGYKGSDR